MAVVRKRRLSLRRPLTFGEERVVDLVANPLQLLLPMLVEPCTFFLFCYPFFGPLEMGVPLT